MSKNKEYDVRGEWYCGNSLEEKLTVDMLPADDLVQKIEKKIKSLRPIYHEFVVVELQDETNIDKTYPLYFQIIRNKSYLKTNTYRAEIGMRKGYGTVLYAQTNLTLNDVLKLFRKICIQREKPNKSEWLEGKRVYGGKKLRAGSGIDDKTDYARYQSILTDCWLYNIVGRHAEFLEYDILEHAVFKFDDPYHLEQLARAYEKKGLYEKLNRLFETHSYHPVVAQIKGEMALHGIFGKPDYKKAFEYFTHAMKIGSLLAEYSIAMMYKHGLYVQQDYVKYEKMLRSVHRKYSSSWIMCCPFRIFLELSKLEQQRDNEEAALDFCLQAQDITRWLATNGYGTVTESDVDITQQIYDLGYFDPDEMGLLDLLVVLKKPCSINIGVKGHVVNVRSYYNNNRVVVKCGEKYYRDAVDFLRKYKVEGKYLTTYIDEIDYMEIV